MLHSLDSTHNVPYGPDRSDSNFENLVAVSTETVLNCTSSQDDISSRTRHSSPCPVALVDEFAFLLAALGTELALLSRTTAVMLVVWPALATAARSSCRGHTSAHIAHSCGNRTSSRSEHLRSVAALLALLAAGLFGGALGLVAARVLALAVLQTVFSGQHFSHLPPCLLLLQLKFTDYWLQQREPQVALLDRPNELQVFGTA
jgi:hypothetical protein